MCNQLPADKGRRCALHVLKTRCAGSSPCSFPVSVPRVGGRWRPYRVGCTGSLPTSGIKRRRARLALGWGAAWEDLRVLPPYSQPGTTVGGTVMRCWHSGDRVGRQRTAPTTSEALVNWDARLAKRPPRPQQPDLYLETKWLRCTLLFVNRSRAAPPPHNDFDGNQKAQHKAIARGF